jgi:uncharacterized membrane protein YphA (DoxX/SURF4 family)
MNGSSTATPPSTSSSEPPRRRAATLLRACCRYLLAAAFLASALTKILEPDAFAGQMAHSGLPVGMARVVIAVLPWLELTCGFCLALGIAVREAALIVAILLVVFIPYAFIHRNDSNCGCLLLPRAVEPINRWPWLPLRNGVLLGCAVWNLWPERKPSPADVTAPPSA